MKPADWGEVALAVTLVAAYYFFILTLLSTPGSYKERFQAFLAKIHWPKCFLFHAWSKWEDTAEGDFMKRIYSQTQGTIQSLKKGTFVRQQKVCAVCGKKRLRTEITRVN